MAHDEVWEGIKFNWEVRYQGSGKNPNRWTISQTDGRPAREAPVRYEDIVKLNSALGNWEVYEQGKWKKVLRFTEIPQTVLTEWSLPSSAGLSRTDFTTHFTSTHSGATKAEVLYLVGKMNAAKIVCRASAEAELSTRSSVALSVREEPNLPAKSHYPSPKESPISYIPTASHSGPVDRSSPLQNSTPIEEAESPVESRNSTPELRGLDLFLPISDSSKAGGFAAAEQQGRLFNDPRRHHLLAELAENKYRYPQSHLSALGDVAQHIFDNGRPARVWTAGGAGSAEVGLDLSTTSIHGKCNCTYEEADFLLLTEKEHAAWAKQKNAPKLIVLRDAEFSKRRPAKTAETWLRETAKQSRSHNCKVDVQRLSRPIDQPAVEAVRLDEALRQWNESRDVKPVSDLTTPLNILNIADNVPGNWPEGLTKEYQLLFDAIAVCDGTIYSSLDEEANLGASNHDIGKPTLMAFSPTDIQKCTQFRILAQRGAVSSWHMDNVGVYTFVVLEGNLNSPGEKTEDVVKYWPVFPMYSLTAADEARAISEYSKLGISWRPKPEGKIPIISLVRGDMLIQPPGTIHAPITLTDCFFLGGMCWRKDTMPLSIRIWDFLTKHPICTNEPLPRQTHMILDYLRSAVHESPAEFGLENSESALAVFDRVCDEICGRVISCSCTAGCRLGSGCSCLAHGLRCGIYCHRGIDHKLCTTQKPPETDGSSSLGSSTKKKKRKLSPKQVHPSVADESGMKQTVSRRISPVHDTDEEKDRQTF